MGCKVMLYTMTIYKHKAIYTTAVDMGLYLREISNDKETSVVDYY